VVGLVLLAAVCRHPGLVEIDHTEMAFGSYVRMHVFGPDSAAVRTAVARAFGQLHRLDTLWSPFLPGSELSRLNRGRKMTVNSATAELVKAAIEAGRKTGGAFDITVQPLMQAWGFYDESHRVPDSAEVQRLLRRVDFRKVTVAGDSIVLPDSLTIDLGGIAVGRAVDQAVTLLQSGGVTQGLVDAGGDIRVFGNRVWRIGLQNPRGDGVLRVFPLKNRAVATSGDYQQFFENGGRRYCHIINPETGYPAAQCVSVTVFARDALSADFWSTALFVLGPAGLERLPAVDSTLGVVMLVPDGKSLRMISAGRIE